MNKIIQSGESKLWDQLFVAAQLPCSTQDVQEILQVSEGPYDNEDMQFEGKFRLKDGRTVTVSGSYAPTYDCVNNATGALS